MTWVLIYWTTMTIYRGQAIATHSVDFHSRDECLYAKRVLAEAATDGTRVTAVCVPKGGK